MTIRQRLNAELDESIKMLRKNGNVAAEAERVYQVTKSQTILRLKDEGYPVTLIKEMVKGDEQVAQKRLERDLARVLYDANKEVINIRKLQLRNTESQIEREWNG